MRALLLTQELLALPTLVRELAETVAHLADRMEQITETVAHLTEGSVTMTTERVIRHAADGAPR